MRKTFDLVKRLIRQVGWGKFTTFVYAFALAHYEELLVKKPLLNIPESCVEYTKAYASALDNYKTSQATYYLVGLGAWILFMFLAVMSKILVKAVKNALAD